MCCLIRIERITPEINNYLDTKIIYILIKYYARDKIIYLIYLLLTYYFINLFCHDYTHNIYACMKVSYLLGIYYLLSNNFILSFYNNIGTNQNFQNDSYIYFITLNIQKG